MTAWFYTLSMGELQGWNTGLSVAIGLMAILTGLATVGLWGVNQRIDTLHKEQTSQVVQELRQADLHLQIEAEQNRITINQHLKDRDIIESQAKILTVALAPLKGKRLALSVVPNDPEAAQFADKVRSSITDSGLIVSLTGQAPAWTQTPRGFGLAIGASRQADAVVLRKALRESGLAPSWVSHQPTTDSTSLELFIGPKP
jgi:hypothetical protein